MVTSGPDKVRYYFERMVGTIVSILAPLSILIFLAPHIFITILAGSKYYAAIPILQIVIRLVYCGHFSTSSELPWMPLVNRILIFG